MTASRSSAFDVVEGSGHGGNARRSGLVAARNAASEMISGLMSTYLFPIGPQTFVDRFRRFAPHRPSLRAANRLAGKPNARPIPAGS